MNKSYNIPIVIHIPSSYPNFPPEFYMLKRAKVGINKVYFENEMKILNQQSKDF